jgi:hypothetical protein
MHHRRLAFGLITAGLLLIFSIGLFFLLPAQKVSAQCGSQASSCKNCHETQAQDPVNNDGTAWHVSHAFGDFCYLCHAGNNQATDKTAAHTGMVDPLKDVVAACKSCHAADYPAKAQGYATTLGVTISDTSAAPAPAAATAVPALSPAAASAAVVPAADMVNFSQRYDEVALGKAPPNVGNIIAIVIIAVLVLGGGFFVARREGWINVSFQETKQIQGTFPADVVDMVPELLKLKPAARKDLRQILLKPATAGELFALVTKLANKDGSASEQDTPAPKEE